MSVAGSHLNCNRIGQPALRRDASQIPLVLGKREAVLALCDLAFLTAWVLTTGFILLLPRVPELHDQILPTRSGRRAIHLARSTNQGLAGHTQLRAGQRTLKTIPDLSGWAKLHGCARFRGCGIRNYFRSSRGSAGTILGA